MRTSPGGASVHFRSQGAASGNPGAPFTAQILRCTRHREKVQHEWPASSLEAAQQQADDWLFEWGVRVGLRQDSSRSSAEARRRRISGVADMPKLPPLKQRKTEVEGPGEGWDLEDSPDLPAVEAEPKGRYATKAEIVRAIAAARAGGLRVAEIQIKRDGSITILSEEASRGRGRMSDYDKWKQDDASRR